MLALRPYALAGIKIAFQPDQIHLMWIGGSLRKGLL
jgi:hypothetical protein